MSEQDTSLETNTSSTQSSPTPENQIIKEATNTINWIFPAIATVISLGSIYSHLSESIVLSIISIIASLFLLIAKLYTKTSASHSKISENENKITNPNDETATQTSIFFLTPLLTYLSITVFLSNTKIPSNYHLPILLISLIPLLPILIYHFHQPNNQKIENIDTPKEERPQPTLEKIKSLTQLIPIIISISFMFILMKNISLVDNDLGAAIHLTAIEFTQYKYEWISFIFIIILIVYSSFLPALALDILRKGIEPVRKIQILEHPRNPYIQWRNNSPTQAATVTAIFKALLSNIILISATIYIEIAIKIILAVNNSPSMATWILLFSSLAYINSHIIILSRKSDNPLKARKILYSSCLKFLLFLAVIFSLAFHESIIYSLKGNLASLGATISSPSRIINNSEETYYSCAFLDKPGSSESIAFGIIASSKDSSIHIFSPIRNEDTGKYAEKKDDGILYPNKLVETHIKVTEGYHIEKFNRSKHWFNPNSGKCVYENTSPFYVSSFPLERNG
ncbi:hypothetical protein [Rothia mucilaginosa]|uniref:hypothetical protein n=1 Tax=Rothia mucilaginosa TaxID=43675 RepID=UPI003C709C87